MNKRINELYKEATGRDWAYDFDPVIAEKFAKLIVLECAKLMAEEKAWYDDPGTCETGDYYKRCAAKADAFDSADSIIKRHFGIE